MTKEFEALVHNIAAEALEELCFMISDADNAPIDAETQITVCVTFSGPYGGKLMIRAPRPVTRAIAQNMLGNDSEFGGDVERDALGEVANVICGNLLPRITDNGGVFSLEGPVAVTENWPPKSPGLNTLVNSRLNLDEGQLGLALLVDPHALDQLVG